MNNSNIEPLEFKDPLKIVHAVEHNLRYVLKKYNETFTFFKNIWSKQLFFARLKLNTLGYSIIRQTDRTVLEVSKVWTNE